MCRLSGLANDDVCKVFLPGELALNSSFSWGFAEVCAGGLQGEEHFASLGGGDSVAHEPVKNHRKRLLDGAGVA